ncbi:MAG: hypothetical protein K2I79_04540, partial [Clostridia bacterium]|nr:hypothetical protein [Clostridia bacterium]
MQYLPAPDFPTGGYIIEDDGIKQAYETGKGRITMRANAYVEENGDKRSIVITEFPYEVQKSDVLRNIMDLREKDKDNFGDIADIVDESDRNGIRAVIKLRKDADAEKILRKLYVKTRLQTAMSVYMVAIADGKPQELGLLDIIKYYVEYQRNVIYKRTRFDLEAAKKREHILQGLLIAVNNIRRVVDIILEAASTTDAKEKLKSELNLSEKQAVAVLDMQLKRLTKLDVSKLIEEIKQLQAMIAEYEAILGSKTKQLGIVRQELLDIKKKYATPRKTKLMRADQLKVDIIDPNAKIERKGMLILTHDNILKLTSVKGYSAALKGIENNSPAELALKVMHCSNMVNTIAFTDKGNAAIFNIESLDEGNWKGKGTPLNKISLIDSDERAVAMFSPEELKGKQLYFYTKLGMV